MVVRSYLRQIILISGPCYKSTTAKITLVICDTIDALENAKQPGSSALARVHA